MKKSKTVSYEEGLLDRLKDSEYASEYLNAQLDEKNFDLAAFLISLRHVATAHGFSSLAKETGLGRESLYKTLSDKGNPKLETLNSILASIGLKINILPGKKNPKKRALSRKKAS